MKKPSVSESRSASARTIASAATQAGKTWPMAVLVLALVAGGGWWWWKSTAGAGAASGPGAAGAGGGGAGGPGGAGGRRFGAGNKAQPVSVMPARHMDIRKSVSAIGTLTASNTSVVRSQVSGLLQHIYFTEGQTVKAGQVLAQVDPRPFEATLAQAEGNLARDRATLENAKVDLLRYQDLIAKDAVAKQQLDTQQALVRQLEGTVVADRAAVDSARVQLSYCRVTAATAGRVGLRQVDVGNMVQPSDVNGIVSLTLTHPMALVFSVPSSVLPEVVGRMRNKQSMVVEALARDDNRFLASGQLSFIDNQIDLSTDTVKLKALFPNQDDMLFPNQSVSVRLQLQTLKDSLAVPTAALQKGTKGFYVYVVGADNSVSSKVIKPGAVDGDWMAVEGELQPGDKIVVDGVDRLRDGAKVEVIAADPRQRAGGGNGGGHRGAGAASGAASGGGHRSAEAAASGARADAGTATASSDADHPAWLDRLPPEVAEKVKKMSPAERQAWIEQRRAERAKREGSGN